MLSSSSFSDIASVLGNRGQGGVSCRQRFFERACFLAEEGGV